MATEELFSWTRALDPSDVADYVIDASGMLQTGEAIASYVFALSDEALDLGLTIGSGAYAVSQPSGSSLRVWLFIDPAFHADPAFDPPGAQLEIILTITTDSVPARTFQRTLGVSVVRPDVIASGLVVEDGTGLPNSESYCSVADADNWHASHGGTDWLALAQSEKQQALRRATNYMLQTYRERWAGYRLHVRQALDWPRYGVTVDRFYVDVNSVPADIANACAELALKAATDDLTPDLTRGVVREKVGPLETEYDRYSPQQTRRPAIEMALSPYLKGGPGMARLVRT